MSPDAYRFSPLILLMLVAMLAAASVVYWRLVHRSTVQWRWVELSDWAKQNSFTVYRRAAKLPPPLPSIQAGGLWVEMLLQDKHASVVRFHTAADSQTPRRWHVLVRGIESDWPATGLRPMAQQASLLDLFSLEEFPHLPHGERFGVIGTQAAAARKLANSSTRALLPADVGLMLHGKFLLIDFSSRPFDEIEIGRMIALANQLMGHMPALHA